MKRRQLFSIALLLVSICALAQTSPQVTIGKVSIVDTPGLSAADLGKIAREVEGTKCGVVVVGCVGDRVLEGFQERGYFKAAVLDPRVKPIITNGNVEATVIVEPGAQYRLRELQFKFGSQPILSKTELAPLITVRVGAIFNIQEMRQTLENLRTFYVSHGYPNVTMVPEITVDDQKRQISINVDSDPECTTGCTELLPVEP